LREFLEDPRVIEVPRWKWWFILNLLILPRRSKESAAKYARIWDPRNGSPLLHITRLQTAAVAKSLPGSFIVRFGMRYGNPNIERAVGDLLRGGVDRIVVLPLYPQYSAASTASACDVLFRTLERQRVMPAIRVVPPFYAHRGYIRAQAAIARTELAKLERLPQKYVFSFHGYPVDFVKNGDPYQNHVLATVRLLTDELRLPEDQCLISYQSRFQKQIWLEPYTEELLCNLARQGSRRVFLMSPGFTTDCLETIDEIGREANEAFLRSGGELLIRCPCLNDHPIWIEAMRDIVLRESTGWYPDESGVGVSGAGAEVGDESTILDLDKSPGGERGERGERQV
jgi:ferrochelatase